MPSMMRRLTSAPKPASRVAVYMPSRPPWRLGAEAVAHAVVAGEVGASTPRARSGSTRPGRAASAAGASSRPSRRAARASSSVSSNAFSTPGSMPSPDSSSGTPRRMPFRSVAVGQLDRLRAGRCSCCRTGPAPTIARQQQRAVGDVARERARLVERGGERDHPVAADRAVGRLHADDPAQRGGLADRAAGVGPDRPRRGAGGDASRASRRCEPPGTRVVSHGFSVGP